MTALDTANVVESFYALLGGGDIEGAIGLMSDDVQLHFPGPDEIPFAGSYRGKSGVGEFFGNLFNSADLESFEVIDLISQDGKAVAVGRERLVARSTGLPWETEWAMVWTVTDGQIIRVSEYHETASIAAAFASVEAAPDDAGSPSVH